MLVRKCSGMYNVEFIMMNSENYFCMLFYKVFTMKFRTVMFCHFNVYH
jgi:hypothetical protein